MKLISNILTQDCWRSVRIFPRGILSREEKLGSPRGRVALCNHALSTIFIISILCRVFNRITDLSGVNINWPECARAM